MRFACLDMQFLSNVILGIWSWWCDEGKVQILRTLDVTTNIHL